LRAGNPCNNRALQAVSKACMSRMKDVTEWRPESLSQRTMMACGINAGWALRKWSMSKRGKDNSTRGVFISLMTSSGSGVAPQLLRPL
jgi:hypothetical protein